MYSVFTSLRSLRAHHLVGLGATVALIVLLDEYLLLLPVALTIVSAWGISYTFGSDGELNSAREFYVFVVFVFGCLTGSIWFLMLLSRFDLSSLEDLSWLGYLALCLGLPFGAAWIVQSSVIDKAISRWFDCQLAQKKGKVFGERAFYNDAAQSVSLNKRQERAVKRWALCVFGGIMCASVACGYLEFVVLGSWVRVGMPRASLMLAQVLAASALVGVMLRFVRQQYMRLWVKGDAKTYSLSEARMRP